MLLLIPPSIGVIHVFFLIQSQKIADDAEIGRDTLYYAIQYPSKKAK